MFHIINYEYVNQMFLFYSDFFLDILTEFSALVWLGK